MFLGLALWDALAVARGSAFGLRGIRGFSCSGFGICSFGLAGFGLGGLGLGGFGFRDFGGMRGLPLGLSLGFSLGCC